MTQCSISWRWNNWYQCVRFLNMLLGTDCNTLGLSVFQFCYTLVLGVYIILIFLRTCECLSVETFFHLIVLNDLCVYFDVLHSFFLQILSLSLHQIIWWSRCCVTHCVTGLSSTEPTKTAAPALDPLTNTLLYTVTPTSLNLPQNHTSHIYPAHNKLHFIFVVDTVNSRNINDNEQPMYWKTFWSWTYGDFYTKKILK